VDGPGLHEAFPGAPSVFYIHPKSAKGNPVKDVNPKLFHVQIVGTVGNDVIPVKLSRSEGHPEVIEAAYKPKFAGPHKVEISVADVEGQFHPIHGSPFDLVIKYPVSASKSKLVGPGITDFDVALTTTAEGFFTIQTFDHDGKPLTEGGAKFDVNIKPPSLFSTVIAFFKSPEVTDNNDGTYTVRYQPRDGGKHIITVTLGGEHVGASPVEVEVEEGTDEGESIAVDYMFTIEARTKSGAPRNRGGDKFEVSITGPDGLLEGVIVEDLSATHPGKYKVFYTLPGKGKYIIKATLNGKDIKGSPWKQKL